MVVVGHRRDQVEAHLAEVAPHVLTAVQSEQLGTGHAVQIALGQLADLSGEVIVTLGDVPLLDRRRPSRRWSLEHRGRQTAITVLTARVPDPTGYGRILRDADGLVTGIVEHKDADAGRNGRSTEINSGIYVFDADVLRAGLARLATDNAQGELYLTDVLDHRPRRRPDAGRRPRDRRPWQTEGVNDRVQLARLNAELNRRILDRWMRDGVTVSTRPPPGSHASVDLAPTSRCCRTPRWRARPRSRRAPSIGPDTTLVDVEVGEGATVTRTHGSLAVIGAGADVGPFAYLRPGTRLGAKGKIGTFVETKNAQIGAGAKVPHLSYAGRRAIGEGANIGAGVIFANYDGVTKSHHRGRRALVRRQQLRAGRAAGDRRRRVRRRRLRASPSDVGTGELAVARGAAAQHPGLGGAEAGRHQDRQGGRSRLQAARETERHDQRPRRHRRQKQQSRRKAPTMSGIKRPNEKHLMLFSGRAYPELADEVAELLGVDLVPTRASTTPTPRSTCGSRSRSAAATRS